MEADGPFHAREALVAAEAVRPLQGPEVDILRPLEERVDQSFALVGTGILEEPDELVRRGDQADQVEVDAAAEHGVAAELGRGDAAAASAWRRRAGR